MHFPSQKALVHTQIRVAETHSVGVSSGISHACLVYSGLLGRLTVERESATRCVLASAVLRHTLIGPGVLLLEIRNFEYGIGVPRLDFAGKMNTAGSSPAYFRDGAVTKGVER